MLPPIVLGQSPDIGRGSDVMRHGSHDFDTRAQQTFAQAFASEVGAEEGSTAVTGAAHKRGSVQAVSNKSKVSLDLFDIFQQEAFNLMEVYCFPKFLSSQSYAILKSTLAGDVST